MRLSLPPHSHTRLPALLLGALLTAASVLGVGCTNDAKLEVPSDAIALMQGKPVPWITLLEFAEFRRDLVQTRNGHIQWAIVNKVFDEAGIALEPSHVEAQFEQVYRQFGGEEAFRQQYQIGTAIPVERFEAEIFNLLKLEALILQDHPVTEESIRQQFDSMPDEQRFSMFGQILGMSEPGPISYEQVRTQMKAFVQQQQAQQHFESYLTRYREEAEAEGRLVIDRLPGETDPRAMEETATEGPRLTPELARAGARLKDDRAGGRPAEGADAPSDDRRAYTLDGEAVGWTEILSDPINSLNLQRHVDAAMQFLAAEYAFEKEGLKLDRKLFEDENQRMLTTVGGREAFESSMRDSFITYDGFLDQLTREVKVRQLLLAAYPIKPETLRARYDERTKADWFMAYQGVLGLQNESEATFARLQDRLYLDAVVSLNTEKRQEYMTTLMTLLRDKKQVIVRQHPLLAAQQPPPPAPQPIIHGLPRLPNAPVTVAKTLHLPESKLKIPASATDAPAEAGQGSHAGHDHDDHAGHNH